ncbi:MAG: ATP-binding protein [Desulfovibrio sp.]|nr:ATP-binding protein [Desulfovibrio sp.]
METNRNDPGKVELREIVVISGKGGTGKTSLTAAFAALAHDAIFCDLDVDVPDLHIILQPTVEEKSVFMGGNTALIDPARCVGCGTCLEVCSFAAIRDEGAVCRVDQDLCEGCSVCVALCPEKAISFPEAICGDWCVSQTRFGPFVHAQLEPGGENSGRLVSLLKRRAREMAKAQGKRLILCDGSPGIGCPVVSSLGGASLAVIVVEPSLSGLHDFKRVADLCAHFQLPAGIVINRADINPDIIPVFEEECGKRSLAVFGRVPYAKELTEKTQQGLAVTEGDSDVARQIERIWQAILEYRPKPRLRSFSPGR